MSATPHPAISVIIPTYQVEDYIVECLQSVCQQDHSLEIILVDDCGTDRSIERAVAYLESQTQIPSERWKVVHHEKNSGLSAARNTGVRNASGDYLFFLDSDDYLPTGALARLYRAVISNEAAIALGVFDIGGGETLSHKMEDNEVVEGEEVLRRYWLRDLYPLACNKLISRVFFIENDLYFADGILHEDEVWSAKCAFCMPRVVGVKSTTYYYRVEREGSIMNSRSEYSERYGYALMIVLQLCTQLGVDYQRMRDQLYREFLQDWQLTILFTIPAHQKWSRRERYAYLERYASPHHPASAIPYDAQMNWRFKVLDKLCKLPKILRAVLLDAFLRMWQKKPDQRLRFILEKNNI